MTSSPGAAPAPVSTAVEDRLIRALAVLRWILLANAVALNAWRHENFERPTLGWSLVAAMVVWTCIASWAYAAPERRTPVLLTADLAIALSTLILTPIAKGVDFNASVPGFWIAGALLAWAIHGRFVGGFAAASLLSVADIVIRDRVEQSNVANVFLLMIAGPIVGYLCDSLVSMARERDLALRAAAVAGERARLARAVHDGVLQVLALMQRRGAEDSGLGALGRMAGEQEASLRALINQQDRVDGQRGGGTSDLTAALQRLAVRNPQVSVALPGTPVVVEEHRAGEIVAVVAACLDNVRVHVGETAPAWVLLDVDGPDLLVSVRDEGPGISEGRLTAAEDEGRLGVRESIRGRVRDLGGRATLETGSFGSEWEFVIPRRAPERPAAGPR